MLNKKIIIYTILVLCSFAVLIFLLFKYISFGNATKEEKLQNTKAPEILTNGLKNQETKYKTLTAQELNKKFDHSGVVYTGKVGKRGIEFTLYYTTPDSISAIYKYDDNNNQEEIVEGTTDGKYITLTDSLGTYGSRFNLKIDPNSDDLNGNYAWKTDTEYKSNEVFLKKLHPQKQFVDKIR